MILLGAPVFSSRGSTTWSGDPGEWARTVVGRGYEAAYSPVDDPVDDRIEEFARAAAAAGVVIAEVGIWRNLIAVDERRRRENIARAQELLDLADRIGARCAVTFAGTRGDDECGPCDENFSDETFALIVDVAREIIDGVRPNRAKLALETMPTVYPDSPASYRALADAIDRDAFGVHFDPVNMIASPRAYAEHRQLIRSFLDSLGHQLVSCHAKDVRLHAAPVCHMDEVAPGQGGLDYRFLLTELSRLPRDIPVMLEHLQTDDEYARAAAFIRAQMALKGP